MTITILNVILVTVILACMVTLLFGINNLFSNGFNSNHDDAERLRRDIMERDDVITENSIFRDLVRERVRVRNNNTDRRNPRP